MKGTRRRRRVKRGRGVWTGLLRVGRGLRKMGRAMKKVNKTKWAKKGAKMLGKSIAKTGVSTGTNLLLNAALGGGGDDRTL